MDLETENRIAAILLKEAAELRRQADREGVHVYFQQPKVRGRPNSRFLTAAVLGVQQHESDLSASCSSSKRMNESSYLGEDEGLRDEDIEKFLQSRNGVNKPYCEGHLVTLGPVKPSSLRSDESSSDVELREHRRKKEKAPKCSEKKPKRKHEAKEKSMDKKKKRKDKKRSKHH
ncbi:hypothetical protein F3Y22_tig00111834pilonHSYRG00335 [Hibiscus syriacus]|uniref:Uncharacterized protein n=1 Tax=Hibiscus syriacus TaxID=106335 RepID=A0A6A2YCF5_HIBSY|nr:hypothetical protein F3Y22_tig00111834pilonHSYRG00335 [Hibiscus syriacus]